MEDKIIQLEMQIAYQENKIEELNQVIIENSKEMQQLNHKVEQLEKLIAKLLEVEGDDSEEDLSYLEAPHYSKR